MLSERAILEVIASMVPNWFDSTAGKTQIELRIGSEVFEVGAMRKPYHKLQQWITKVIYLSNQIINLPSSGSTVLDRLIVQNRFSKEWLEINGYKCDWERLFEYNHILQNRTYENDHIAFNFICVQDQSEGINLVNACLTKEQKLLDVLAQSQYTYFKVNSQWDLLDYDYVELSSIPTQKRLNYIPQFLFPFQKTLESGQCGISRSKRGDMVVFDSSGLLASFRKGSWRIYQTDTLKNTIMELFHSHINTRWHLAPNIMNILFDLSYRRHGALLVFDRKGTMINNVTNPQCFLSEPNENSINHILSTRLERVNLASDEINEVSKPLVIELASVDGALIFDSRGRITAYGAMINTHPRASTEIGARSTAALSAFFYDALPFKVSSDGEIVTYVNRYYRETDPVKVTII